jgi:hypothetical protein
LRLVHISDLHLGYRQYQRLTPAGINQREADVASAFRRAIDRIIELHPDVILVAGDVFHSVRPSNPAILHAFQQFSRLVSALPDATIVMVSGNHDTPRSTETGWIVRLFSQLGISVVDGEPRHIPVPAKDLNVLAVPHVLHHVKMDPDPAFGCNVLLIHTRLRGVTPGHDASDDRPIWEIDAADLNAPLWSYVALGHYHVFREVLPNAFYSGSIEYTSNNPWGELREEAAMRISGKGFIEYDTDTGVHTFHAIPLSRSLVDLTWLNARGKTAIEIDEMIRASVDSCPGGIDDKVVRLVLRDVPRHIARELDHTAIRGYKRRALHFLLDTRRPDIARPSQMGSGAPGTRRSLEDTVREKLNARELEPDIDRQALVQLALDYLRHAEAADAVKAEVEA